MHHPDALPIIIDTLTGRVGRITILPVYPRRDLAAIRILVRGKKGSRAPLAIAAPLILHEGEAFSPAADAIHRGCGTIEW
ncbi:hypothetical protein CU048_06790 [Beijerinckiaceae bacterium]|nr:hypothetical protein CU048_06790 [Beijerinckiaceae bacterium]